MTEGNRIAISLSRAGHGFTALAVTLIAWSTACAGTPDTDPATDEAVPAASTQSTPLPFVPTHLTSVARDGEVWLYLESATASPHASYGLRISAGGQPLGPPVPLVSGFARHFGEVFASPRGGVVLAVVTQQSDAGVALEMWRWTGAGPPELDLRCPWPFSVHGQLLEDHGDLTLLFEREDGALWSFRTALGELAQCPTEEDVQRLLPGPLPRGYLLALVGERLVLAGQVGETYQLSLFDRRLELVRTVRLAAGAATDPLDISLAAGADGMVAVYGARSGGSPDLYIAALEQFSVGRAEDRRIVASADAERMPQLSERGGRWVVSWIVEQDSAGERLLLAAPVPADGTALLRGGEVVWRRPHAATVYDTSWTAEGLLAVWVEAADTAPVLLHTRVYRPTFWE